MKKNLTFILASLMIIGLISSSHLYAQQKASPAKVAQATVNGNEITIKYGSPFKKGRAIYGGLVPYDKVWRTGANEATTLELSKDATIGGMAVKAGKYALFTIPGESSWTIIINKEPKQWGAYKYNSSQDLGRFTVTPATMDEEVESFTIAINESGTVSLSWDKTQVSFEIK